MINLSFLITVLLLSFAAHGAEVRDLNDCMRAALERSETVHDAEAQIGIAEERYRQAFGGVLPAFNGFASYTVQQTPSGVGAQIFPATQPLARLTASQALFRGLREFAALRQTRDTVEAQREAHRRAAQLLYVDVASAYYTVLQLEQDLDNVITQEKLLERRVGELKGRVSIGRSRKSELLASESQLSGVRAQAEQVRGQLAAAREGLNFLTSFPRDVELKKIDSSVPALPPLDDYVGKLESRPDVGTARYTLLSSEESVSIARGAFLPSLDLLGNYYFKRAGSLANVHWDVQVAMTVPLFSGGTDAARLREARLTRERSDLNLSLVRRQADREIRTLYSGLVAELATVSELEKARDNAQKSFEAQNQDYRLGLVTNLDVLAAMSAYRDAQRAFDRERFNVRINVARLQAAAGQAEVPTK